MTTVQVNGDDIMMAVHVARIVGSIVMTLLVGLAIWWAIRPPRRVRDRRKAAEREAALSDADNEDLWRVVDRMEERLEVLERALADELERPRLRGTRDDRILAPADEDRDSGRTK
jgi:hypothetical protein